LSVSNPFTLRIGTSHSFGIRTFASFILLRVEFQVEGINPHIPIPEWHPAKEHTSGRKLLSQEQIALNLGGLSPKSNSSSLRGLLIAIKELEFIITKTSVSGYLIEGSSAVRELPNATRNTIGSITAVPNIFLAFSLGSGTVDGFLRGIFHPESHKNEPDNNGYPYQSLCELTPIEIG
jgi:hypothetical protein